MIFGKNWRINMTNKSKKDFNVMMRNNKDMPKIQVVEDKKIWWN